MIDVASRNTHGYGTRHLTPLHMTRKIGNAHRPSKLVKWMREEKRMRKKFGVESEQYKHFRTGRFASVVVKTR